MQLLPQSAGGAPRPIASQPPGSEASALLAWWRAAGADTVLADAPTSWLQAPTVNPVTPAHRHEPTIPKHLPIAQSAPQAIAAWSSTASTLAGLLAEVHAKLPLAPIADGNPASGIMILGEAPSAEDLRTGRPFTGPAGHLLDQMLAAIGLDRTSCYISLLAPRRRIPGPPPPDAIAADLPLTFAHIRLAAPRLVLLLGAAATQAISGQSGAISALRGRWLDIAVGDKPIPALPTFNPAYLLRRPEAKREAWADLLEFKSRIAGGISA